MSIKEKLEIIIVTYNRDKYLKRTLEQIFDENSPIKKFKITILDNNSTDNTKTLVEECQKKHLNLVYKKNKYNVCWTNIAKAFEMAEKEYVWVLADDDSFDFTNWEEIENIISNESADIICTCSHILDTEEKKNNLSYQFIQLTLLPAGIYKTACFDDSLIKSMYDNIYTMFPHSVFAVNVINNNGKIVTLKNEILKIGINIEETDCSYNRGLKLEEVWPRNRSMNWLTGFSNICSGLNDKKFTERTLKLAINEPWVYGSVDECCNKLVKNFHKKINWANLVDIYVHVDSFIKHKLMTRFLMYKIIGR